MMKALTVDGKVAVVTGARKSIGRAVALTLAEAGADVAVCSRKEGIDQVAQEIERLGRRSLALRADVSRKADIERFFDKVVEKFGRIDILVNNAGVVIWNNPLLEATEEDWDALMNINLKGAWLCAREAGKHMKRQRGGVMVNIGSIAGNGPDPSIPIYSIAKSGTKMLTRTLAQELAPFNVRVNAVEPGWVRTDMNIHLRKTEEAEKKLSSTIPCGRISDPEDIANIVLFLVSESSWYITGQSILADGGLFDKQ